MTWYKGIGRWRVRITHDGKQHSLGYFDDEQDAARAYEAARASAGSRKRPRSIMSIKKKFPADVKKLFFEQIAKKKNLMSSIHMSGSKTLTPARVQ